MQTIPIDDGLEIEVEWRGESVTISFMFEDVGDMYVLTEDQAAQLVEALRPPQDQGYEVDAAGTFKG